MFKVLALKGKEYEQSKALTEECKNNLNHEEVMKYSRFRVGPEGRDQTMDQICVWALWAHLSDEYIIGHHKI